MGDGSWSATGCEPVGTLQSAEAADQGDAGDGCGWISHTHGTEARIVEDESTKSFWEESPSAGPPPADLFGGPRT